MSKSTTIFRSALLLTAVNLLLRLAGTSFQVFLSSSIGAEGIGLLQLVLSVGGLALVIGTGGIRTATMYLCAEQLGRKRQENIMRILSGCLLYSILFSTLTACLLSSLAPKIAREWIGDLQTLPALKLFAVFLPCGCLCGVMTGYFTAERKIGTLAAVQVAEQILSMGITFALLTFWVRGNPGRACLSVVLGSSLGACMTLLCLVALRHRERGILGPPLPVALPLCRTGLPLALADTLRTGISTVENLMVPQRLRLNASVVSPLADFGTVTGMVFPVLMFPACILYALAELLIPELARCRAAESNRRVRYLMKRSLKSALLYSLIFSGLLFLLAEPLCLKLYGSADAGRYLRLYALLIPMLYCDAITDAMIKGLGQQTASVRYNILTNLMDVVFLYLLLPRYGMEGYFFSFLITHLVNFSLSLRRLLKITGVRIPVSVPLRAGIALSSALILGSLVSSVWMRIVSFLPALGAILSLLGILKQEDIRWLRGLISKR